MAKVRQFGTTWWGKAWLDALEQRSLIDPNRLPRGRTYARQDRVRDIELSPGELRAQVSGNQEGPYTTTLSMRVLADSEWDTVLDLAMTKASNVAALLAGQVPKEIGDHVLPDRGDLSPECSCPDWAEPCKHVAALCYVAADMFDADPFALLTLRGLSRDAVLTEVRSRRSERLGVDLTPSSDQPRGGDPAISGAQAFRRKPTQLQQSAPLPSHPGTLVALTVIPGMDAGIDADELAELVSDAAERAWSMLAGGTDSGLDLSIGADVVRRAARGTSDQIAEATGLDPNELRAAVTAWHIGGLDGFRAHSAKPAVNADLMIRGQLSLGEGARVRGNTVSFGTTQLRLDQDQQWWRFTADDDLGWLLAEGPTDDPNDLL
ncbi:MAG: SWIM zinc finger family protein [Acidimicrobiales bacterium]